MKKLALLSKARHFAHRFPLGKKSALLPRLMRSLFRNTSGQVLVSDFDGSFRMRLDLAEHMQRRMFWVGYYNREIVALFDTLIKPGMIVFDIGANIGEITLVAAKRATHTGKVVAFEPMRSIAEQLEENIRENELSWVTVERMGLSDHTGQANIYDTCAQWNSDEPHRGLGSLYPADANSPPVQAIELTTLDEYLRQHPTTRLDIIKVDIEGAELPCLIGALATLERFQPLLIIEIQAETSRTAGYEQSEILSFLSKLGYRFHRIGSTGQLKEIHQEDLVEYQNVLCIHSCKTI